MNKLKRHNSCGEEAKSETTGEKTQIESPEIRRGITGGTGVAAVTEVKTESAAGIEAQTEKGGGTGQETGSGPIGRTGRDIQKGAEVGAVRLIVTGANRDLDPPRMSICIAAGAKTMTNGRGDIGTGAAAEGNIDANHGKDVEVEALCEPCISLLRKRFSWGKMVLDLHVH
jgi:hypothetical protein